MVKSAADLLKKRIKDERKAEENGDYPSATEFFKLLSLCNTVVCEQDKDTKDVKYSASSPDELALVQGSAQVGIQLLTREHGKLYIVNRNTKDKLVYEVKAEFPFDSNRKRMSVILKDEDGKYFILCKGADTVMYDRISYHKNGIENMRKILE